MGMSAFNRARRLKAEKEKQHIETMSFTDMTDDQLSDYAETIGVDISRVKSREAAIAKLEKAEQGAE